MKDFLLDAHGKWFVTEEYLFKRMRAERWTGLALGFLLGVGSIVIFR